MYINKNLVCVWIDKKNFLIHYRIMKIYARKGLIVHEVHEILLFRQSVWRNIKILLQLFYSMDKNFIISFYLFYLFYYKNFKEKKKG